MATKKTMSGFEDLIKLASQFVEQQKGAWDHTAWMDFISDLQKKGLETNEEFKSQLGTVVESMKNVYNALTATKSIESAVADLSDNTVQFIKKNKGVWDHSEWETFIKDIQKKGIELNEEAISYMGGVVEASKSLYSLSSTADK